MNRLEKVLYTAKAHTTGGRAGVSRSSDDRLEVRLSRPACFVLSCLIVDTEAAFVGADIGLGRWLEVLSGQFDELVAA